MKHHASDFDPIPVKAYNFHTGALAGTFESISQASRKLFIRRSDSINKYINSNRASKGVKSYKDGTMYHFDRA